MKEKTDVKAHVVSMHTENKCLEKTALALNTIVKSNTSGTPVSIE